MLPEALYRLEAFVKHLGFRSNGYIKSSIEFTKDHAMREFLLLSNLSKITKDSRVTI